MSERFSFQVSVCKSVQNIRSNFPNTAMLSLTHEWNWFIPFEVYEKAYLLFIYIHCYYMSMLTHSLNITDTFCLYAKTWKRKVIIYLFLFSFNLEYVVITFVTYLLLSSSLVSFIYFRLIFFNAFFNYFLNFIGNSFISSFWCSWFIFYSVIFLSQLVLFQLFFCFYFKYVDWTEKLIPVWKAEMVMREWFYLR